MIDKLLPKVEDAVRAVLGGVSHIEYHVGWTQSSDPVPMRVVGTRVADTVRVEIKGLL